MSAVLRRAFVFGCDTGSFRICQFSIQGNHIHLVCEALDAPALSKGMQSWSLRVVHGINDKLGRRGTVFADRYHSEIMRTPRQVRNTLCYVLQNARRHGLRLPPRYGGVDPYSSAWYFDGWRKTPSRTGVGPPPDLPGAPGRAPVAEPHTWLLATGWRRHGLIGVDEVPAAAKRPRRRHRRSV